MAELKRLQRLLQIVSLLGSGKSFNARQLGELCGISRRTAFRDLAALQEAGFVILYDETQRTYRLPQRTTLPTTDFTVPEAISLLVLGLEVGAKQPHVPIWSGARSAALKLLEAMPAGTRDKIRAAAEKILIRLDGPIAPSEQLAEVFQILQEAVIDQRCIRIEYDGPSETLSTRFNPYRLLFLRRSWYAIGRSSLHRQIRTFKVAWIKKAELLDVKFVVPPRFNLDAYLGNAWHIIREPRNRQAVVIRFQPEVARNVAEIQWHKSQKLRWNADGTLTFEAVVDGLGEIAWWVLGYGDKAEVLRPAELRDIITRHARNLAALYAGGS